MSSFLKDHLDFLRLLASTHRSQRLQLLHTIDNGQFDILIEVVYNILQGVRDFEEKKSISAPNNINLETDLYNKEKSKPDKECGDKSDNQHFNKRTYNDLQNVNTEGVLESVHQDTLNGKARVNQSEALQTTEAHRDKSDDSVIKLAVRSTPKSIVNCQKASASRRKTYRN